MKIIVKKTNYYLLEPDNTTFLIDSKTNTLYVFYVEFTEAMQKHIHIYKRSNGWVKINNMKKLHKIDFENISLKLEDELNIIKTIEGIIEKSRRETAEAFRKISSDVDFDDFDDFYNSYKKKLNEAEEYNIYFKLEDLNFTKKQFILVEDKVVSEIFKGVRFLITFKNDYLDKNLLVPELCNHLNKDDYKSVYYNTDKTYLDIECEEENLNNIKEVIRNFISAKSTDKKKYKAIFKKRN